MIVCLNCSLVVVDYAESYPRTPQRYCETPCIQWRLTCHTLKKIFVFCSPNLSICKVHSNVRLTETKIQTISRTMRACVRVCACVCVRACAHNADGNDEALYLYPHFSSTLVIKVRLNKFKTGLFVLVYYWCSYFCVAMDTQS